MLAVSIGILLKQLSVLNPMFCGSCLLQKGGTRKDIKLHAHGEMMKLQFVVTREPPPEFDSKVKYLEALFAHMDYTDDATRALLKIDGEPRALVEVGQPSARHRARKRAAYLLGASHISEGRILTKIHWCPWGCHASGRLAINETNACMDMAFLDVGVGIPVINKWVKMYKPTAFWNAGNRLDVLPAAFQAICGKEAETAKGMSHTMREADLWGIEDPNNYQVKKLKRFRKTNDWTHEASTDLSLGTATTLLGVAATEMSSFFQEAAWGTGSKGMLDFISMTRNPAAKVSQRCRCPTKHTPQNSYQPNLFAQWVANPPFGTKPLEVGSPAALNHNIIIFNI
jgi:hypothetical protein